MGYKMNGCPKGERTTEKQQQKKNKSIDVIVNGYIFAQTNKIAEILAKFL